MKIIAHRCGDTKFPEGTTDAARHALSIGADYLEIDVRHTADGSRAAVHDSTLLRLFGIDKRIGEIDDATFRKLRYPDSPKHHPHLLQEFLQAGFAPLLLHIKEGGPHLAGLIAQLVDSGYGRRVVFGVTNVEDLRLVKDADPAFPTLGFMRKAEEWRSFVEAGADIIRLWDAWTTTDRIQDIQNRSREVWIMTGRSTPQEVGVTTAQRLLELKQLGIDGILVNDVPQAIRVFGPTPSS